MTETPLLSIRSPSKIYGDTPVVDRVSLDVECGEIVMVVGPSGAGKSTLLRCINRIEPPSEGDVLLDGVNMAGEIRNGRLVPDAASVTPASAAGSAWCSSASTCSRISRRWRTSPSGPAVSWV